MALKIMGVGIVVCFVLIVGVFAYFRKDLPDITNISSTKIGGSITYTARDGQTVLWQDYEAVKRVQVAGDSISNHVKQATIAIEDKDFYEHGAFDVRGIVRAGIHDLTNPGEGIQGGSTISQQLVKLNLNWTADRSIPRKIKEVILAVEIEREYSKQDILTGYLNVAPYGPVEYGVQTAAQDYFGVDAKDLTLSQAAMLAAIPKSPNVYSPYGPLFNAEELLGRQHYILDQMVSEKMITRQQADEAKKVDVLAQVRPRVQKYEGIKAPYFVLAAKDELEAKYGSETVKRGGWKVTTTLDMNLQSLAEKAVNNALPIIKRQGGDTAAFVAEDNKTGQIVALVGGTEFNDPNSTFGKINYAHSVNISPGSTFKPYDYAVFIDNNNAGAGSILYDNKAPLPGYPCTNKNHPKSDKTANCLHDYDFRFPDAITLRYALGGSRNIPAVKAMLAAVPNDTSAGRVASINKVVTTTEAMMGNPEGYRCYQPGIDIFTAAKEDEAQCYGSAAIGDGAYLHLDDHVNGLATIARNGAYVPRTYILKITDSSNKVINEFKQPTGKQVIKTDSAYIVNNMMSDPSASYLSGNNKFHRYKGWNFAIKTGTTNDAFDGLMASWSTQYTAVTWVGYHTRNKAMTGFMETMTAPIVRSWMQGAHDASGVKAINWTQPSGIKTLPAYRVRSKVSNGLGETIPSSDTDIYPSWYTPPKNSANSAQTIDQVSNKLATACTPERAKKVVGGANSNAFSADPFVGTSGGAAATTAADDIHNCNDAKPLITLAAPDTCKGAGDCAFTVTVLQGTHPLSSAQFPGTVTLTINGQQIDSRAVSESPTTLTFTYSPTTEGTAKVEATVIDSVLYSSSESANVSFEPE